MSVLLLFLLCGCVRREGRNSDCQRSRTAGTSDSHRDLRADLEFAEDLAIRYMDKHYGPRDPAAAAKAKDRCLGTLLGEIGKEHGMTARQAFQSIGRRSIAIDVVVIFPFVLLYLAAARILVRRIARRHPLTESPAAAVVMILLAALAFGAIGTILAQQWAELSAAIRIGTAHLSGRALRLPLRRNPGPVFATGVALFLIVASVQNRRWRTPWSAFLALIQHRGVRTLLEYSRGGLALRGFRF